MERLPFVQPTQVRTINETVVKAGEKNEREISFYRASQYYHLFGSWNYWFDSDTGGGE